MNGKVCLVILIECNGEIRSKSQYADVNMAYVYFNEGAQGQIKCDCVNSNLI